MNSIDLTLDNVDMIIREAARGDLSFAEKAGLFAATKAIASDLRRYTDEQAGGDGYAHEKIGQIVWHIGAALGFDTTNNHDAEAHRSWAIGSVSSLRSTLVNRRPIAGSDEAG